MGKGNNWGDTLKPPAGRTPHPFWVEMGKVGGHPQAPSTESPAPLGNGERGRAGGSPQAPGGEGPAPLVRRVPARRRGGFGGAPVGRGSLRRPGGRLPGRGPG